MKALTLSLPLAAAIATLGAGCASSNAPQRPVYSQYPAGNQYPAASHPHDNSRNAPANDPNQTARGAAAGAVAGAVIGGVIGNNSEHGNTEKGAAIGAVAGGVAGAAMGRRADQREAGAYGSQDAAYTVRSIPPSPVSEPQENPPPQPSANAVWIRGHYDYTGNGYQWQSGRWEIPPAGSRGYTPGRWEPAANGGYIFVRGHWE